MSLSVSCPNCGKRFNNIKPELAGKKAKCGCGQIVRLGDKRSNADDSDSHSQSDDLVAENLMRVDLLGDQRPTQAQPAAGPEESVLGQSYGDLESILEGTGNAAPIVARPPDEVAETPADEVVERKRAGSPVGFLSALLSATLAFWFGVFALTSKFNVIDQLLTSGFSNALHRMYTVDFGSHDLGELSGGSQTLFSVFGWSFWVVAVCLMVLGATQFLNSLYRLFTKRHFLRSIDGLTATCGVVTVFLLVGWIFAQASVQREQHRFLNEYEKPATIVDEHLEVVTLRRAEVDAQHRSTRNWLLAGALVPMSVFVLSMARLLTLKPDRAGRG